MNPLPSRRIMMSRLYSPASRFLSALGLLTLAACSSVGLGNGSEATGAPAVASAETLNGLPVPPGSTARQDKSFIVGSGENWFGRITLKVKDDADDVTRFFLQNYPQRGWTLVSSVRSDRSLLVMTKPDRNLTIEIIAGYPWSGTEAVLTISPMSSSPAAAPAPAGGGATAPGVVIKPIR
jgi:hypothetical protein